MKVTPIIRAISLLHHLCEIYDVGGISKGRCLESNLLETALKLLPLPDEEDLKKDRIEAWQEAKDWLQDESMKKQLKLYPNDEFLKNFVEHVEDNSYDPNSENSETKLMRH